MLVHGPFKLGKYMTLYRCIKTISNFDPCHPQTLRYVPVPSVQTALKVASGSEDKTTKLWDVATHSCLNTFYEHSDVVTSVAFHPSNVCLASCGLDKTIKIWDTRSNTLIQHYDAHTAAVNSIRFHPTGNFLISSSADNTLKIWDLREGHLMYTLQGHQASANSATFSPNGDFSHPLYVNYTYVS